MFIGFNNTILRYEGHLFMFLDMVCISTINTTISIHLLKGPASIYQLSCDLRFQTMWYVRPAEAQISLRISFGVFKLKMRLHRLF